MIARMAILSVSLFIAIFATVVLRVVRKGARAYDPTARLPLENDHV